MYIFLFFVSWVWKWISKDNNWLGNKCFHTICNVPFKRSHSNVEDKTDPRPKVQENNALLCPHPLCDSPVLFGLSLIEHKTVFGLSTIAAPDSGIPQVLTFSFSQFSLLNMSSGSSQKQIIIPKMSMDNKEKNCLCWDNVCNSQVSS